MLRFPPVRPRTSLLVGGLAAALLALLTPGAQAAPGLPGVAAPPAAQPVLGSPSAPLASMPSTPPVASASSLSPRTASPVPLALRIRTSAPVVRPGRPVTVSARLVRPTGHGVGGVLLDLRARRPGGGFAVVTSRRTAADGLVAVPLTLRTTTEYQVRTAAGAPGAAASAVVRVHVRPVLTAFLAPPAVQVGRPAVLSGRLTPAYLGARLSVQRRYTSGWRTVARVGTDRTGAYRWTVQPGTTGRFLFRVVLAAGPAHLGAVTPARALVAQPRVLRPGDRGPAVRALQQRLAALRMDVGAIDGVYGSDLAHAVTAFQKTQRLPRTGVVDRATSARLSAPQPIRVRYPARGRAVEVDLTRQVLLVSEGGRLTRVVDVSTGNDALYVSGGVTYRAYTPLGRFRVQRKIDGLRVSRLGVLYRPAYFVAGWAIHGSPKVPPYPDSHGCVRVTNRAMDRLYGLLAIGVPVTVYRS